MTETARIAAKTRLYAALYLGNYEDAIEAAEEVVRAGGLIDSEIAWGLALAHLRRGHYARARKVLHQALARERSNPALWWMLGHVERSSRLADRAARAEDAWRTGIANVQGTTIGGAPANPRVAAWLAGLLACLGDAESVHQIKDDLTSHRNGYLLYRLAVAEAELGHADHAVALLHDAVGYGFRALEQLRQEEFCGLGSLRDDPRYQAIVADLGQRVGSLRGQLADRGIWELLDAMEPIR